MVKQLQLFNRSAFYRKFVEHNFFVPLSSCLMQPSPCMRLAGIDVLLSTVQCRRMRAVAPPQRPSSWPRFLVQHMLHSGAHVPPHLHQARPDARSYTLLLKAHCTSGD